MKFIHFCNIGIGSSAESGTPWEEARSLELRSGLERVMREAADYGAALVIVSGGLFSHVPVSTELEQANRVFAAYPGIEVVITAGSTDPVTKSAPVLSFAWNRNVHYAVSEHPERIVLQRLRTEVYAASVTEQAPSAAELTELAGIEREDVQPIRIAVLTAGDEELRTAFGGTGISYAAAGSSIPGRRAIAGNIHFPGAFEPDAMGDSGEHGILEGEISEQTGLLEGISFKPMAAASYVPLLIRTNAKTTGRELEDMVRAEITRRGSSNIYRLKLTGQRNPEESFALDKLRKECRISEIIDETEPEYDFRKLFAEHPQDMIGFYIARIVSDKHEMSQVERMAMFYGLDALLKTTED